MRRALPSRLAEQNPSTTSGKIENTSIRTARDGNADRASSGSSLPGLLLCEGGGVIFHIAERAAWEQAVRAGQYTVSTRGRSLAEEGFIHMSTESQVAGVAERFYADVPDLVLLHVDESRLTAPLQWDPVPGAADPFPHLYGPLNADAVVEVEDFPSR